jgi:hypothetical protein
MGIQMASIKPNGLRIQAHQSGHATTPRATRPGMYNDFETYLEDA